MERYNDIRGIRLIPLISPQSVLSPAHPPHTKKTLPSHTRWCKMILWIYFTLGNIFGFRAESRSEGTRDPLLFAPGARALTPDQQDGVGKKLLLLQKNFFFFKLYADKLEKRRFTQNVQPQKIADYFGIIVEELMDTKKSPPGWTSSTNRCRKLWRCLTAQRRSSATRWKRCCAPGQSRSESADKRQICFGRGFGQDGQNLGDQIRVLPQDSKDFFICHYAKTLLFVVPIILCYNSYEPTSREKRKIK